MKGFQKVRTLIARIRKFTGIFRGHFSRTLISGHDLRSGHFLRTIRNVRRTLIVYDPYVCMHALFLGMSMCLSVYVRVR